jgi:hypothetical protein
MIAHIVYIVILLFVCQIKQSTILSCYFLCTSKIVLTYMYKIVYVGGGVIQGYISGESESSVLRVLRLQYVHMFQCWHGIGVFTRGQIEMYY